MTKTLEKFFLEFCHPSFVSDVGLMTNQKWLCLIKAATLELPVQVIGSFPGDSPLL